MKKKPSPAKKPAPVPAHIPTGAFAPKPVAPEPPKCQACLGTGKAPNHFAIGQKLRKQRTTANLEAKAVAADMGISAGYLSDLERGKRPWTLDLKAKFEKAIGLPPVPEKKK